jgi:hypothetical protein
MIKRDGNDNRVLKISPTIKTNIKYSNPRLNPGLGVEKTISSIHHKKVFTTLPPIAIDNQTRK